MRGRRYAATAIVLGLMIAWGCGDDGTSKDDSDASASDGGASPPANAAKSVALDDQDLAKGAVGGIVFIGKADDETNVTQYDLYWGADNGDKISLIAKTPVTGSDLSYELADSAIPAGATKLLVFTANGDAESATPTSGSLLDNYPIYVDISAGVDAGVGDFPAAVLDAAHHAIVVLGSGGFTADGGVIPGQGTACDLDDTLGSSCRTRELPTGQIFSITVGLQNPSVALDTSTSTSYFAAEGHAFAFPSDGVGGGPCTLGDGGPACGVSLADISINGTLKNPSVVIDSPHATEIVVSDNGGAPEIDRCPEDGGTCAMSTVDVGDAGYLSNDPSAVIDDVGKKLLVVTENGQTVTSDDGLAIFRCDLTPPADAGAACSFSLSPNEAGFLTTGHHATALIDHADQKLLIVSGVVAATLRRCDLDGTNCSLSSLWSSDAGMVVRTQTFVAVLDEAFGKVDVITINQSGAPLLIRCNLDGSSCRVDDLSATLTHGLADEPALVIDPTAHRLYVVSTASTMYVMGL